MKTTRSGGRVAFLLAALCFAHVTLAQDGDEEDLAQVYGDKSVVTAATGTPQSLARAPAVATVLTAADIEALGARDLDDVLAQVPGLHISRSYMAYNPIYSFRGVDTQYNPQVLLLVNGIPITSVFLGERGNLWGGMPAYNISRVEVVRGPGSALYGADALTGVISIFTKTPAELIGTKIIADAGVHRTTNLAVTHGSNWGSVQIGAFFRFGTTDGLDKDIPVDAQNGLDKLYGTHASLAPGRLQLSYKALDAQLDLVSGAVTFRTAYKKRSDMGSGSGVANALDRDGRNSTERITADLTWRDANLFNNWDLSIQGNFFHLHEKSELVLFPPGAFGNTFPDGMRGSPMKWERHMGVSATALYSGFDHHRIRLGSGYEILDLYKVQELKNYTYEYVEGVGNIPKSLGPVIDVSDTNPFLRPHSRQVSYVFAQDEWTLAPDWALTAGIRHDRYSDFGHTTNPRLALIWDATYNITAKLLYGKAFRPPSFVELYNINNPVVIGNPTVKPETITTQEAAVTWQITNAVQLSMNAYWFDMKDILRFVPNTDPTTGNTAQNAGRLKGRGAEFEVTWNASRKHRLSGYLAVQHTRDPETGLDPGNAPRKTAWLRSDWRFLPGWALNTQVSWVADRVREPGDTRAPVKDYTLTDLTVRTDSAKRDWSLALVVRNLFNVDAREPSPAPGLIQEDFPLGGRSAYLQGSLYFR